MRRTRPGTVRKAVGAAATSAVLLLAGCTNTSSPGSGTTNGSGGLAVDVDVDTPALRDAKEKAGLVDCPAVESDGAEVPEGSLPAVTLSCLGGGPDVDLSALKGPLVVNLWAQWCGPCRKELPYYQQLHERAGDRLQVLGVDYQDTRPDWAIDLLRETGAHFPSVADPGGQLRVPLRVRGLPVILLVDEQGRVVHQQYVAIDSYEQLAGLVEKHLGVTVGAAG